jgi:hypothetical protein
VPVASVSCRIISSPLIGECPQTAASLQHHLGCQPQLQRP